MVAAHIGEDDGLHLHNGLYISARLDTAGGYVAGRLTDEINVLSCIAGVALHCRCAG